MEVNSDLLFLLQVCDHADCVNFRLVSEVQNRLVNKFSRGFELDAY